MCWAKRRRNRRLRSVAEFLLYRLSPVLITATGSFAPMDFVREFWESQGRTHKTSHAASWGDLYAIELEIRTISKFINAGQRVLDVGCANGYSTFRQLELQPEASFTGLDYAGAMIESANYRKREQNLPDVAASFYTASILDLPFDKGSFDVVYTTRVLINLTTWEQQIRGMEECLRVARPGGRVIFSEAFWEPLCLLNSLRLLLQLPPLVEHDFNRYLKKARLDRWLNQRELAFAVEEFSSIYYLGSRFVREFVEGSGLEQG